jgi:hypothetical protein
VKNNYKPKTEYIKIAIAEDYKKDFFDKCNDNNHVPSEVLRRAIYKYLALE